MLAAGALVASVPAPAASLDQWQPQVVEAGRRFGVPADWIVAVIAAESDGNPLALSPKGAMGLMQLMPDTWTDLRRLYGLGGDPFDPGDNILAGAAYLRILLERFGYPGLFAAYNAGPARYEAFLRDGLPLPAETQRYLAALTQMRVGPTKRSGEGLFFPLGGDVPPTAKADGPVAGGLFVPLITPPAKGWR
ncbi:transglycosylase-like protein with SLT domain [Nitrospirillum viridazoti]|uniref:Transglycosylase-like protein with SLT domain n=2 Tax=Nitrospirillum TaxID=1543705 RepID=A0A560HM20_9PROT|nr:transglycosylase-like protein with SLT domain [Nitrospirillum amazonense]